MPNLLDMIFLNTFVKKWFQEKGGYDDTFHFETHTEFTSRCVFLHGLLSSLQGVVIVKCLYGTHYTCATPAQKELASEDNIHL